MALPQMQPSRTVHRHQWLVALVGLMGLAILLADLAPTSARPQLDRSEGDSGWIGTTGHVGLRSPRTVEVGDADVINEGRTVTLPGREGGTLREMSALVEELRATELTDQEVCAITCLGCHGCSSIHRMRRSVQISQ